MTKIIAVANQKGGVGKTTIAAQLAFKIAKQKKKVLCLDFDAQGNMSSSFSPKKEIDGELVSDFYGTTTHELFNEKLDSVEVMRCPSGVDLIYTEENDLMLAEVEHNDLDIALIPQKNLEKIIPNYDYVIIDCPPSLGRKLVAALIIATHVVSPLKLSGFAVKGLKGLLNTFIQVQTLYNPSLVILGFIVNDFTKSVSHKEELEKLIQTVPDMVFKNKIMNRPPLDTAMTQARPVWDVKYGHVAAKEVDAVLNELIKKANQ